MEIIGISDMKLEYNWGIIPEFGVHAYPEFDIIPFDKTNGWEVLYFINKFAEELE